MEIIHRQIGQLSHLPKCRCIAIGICPLQELRRNLCYTIMVRQERRCQRRADAAPQNAADLHRFSPAQLRHSRVNTIRCADRTNIAHAARLRKCTKLVVLIIITQQLHNHCLRDGLIGLHERGILFLIRSKISRRRQQLNCTPDAAGVIIIGVRIFQEFPAIGFGPVKGTVSRIP